MATYGTFEDKYSSMKAFSAKGGKMRWALRNQEPLIFLILPAPSALARTWGAGEGLGLESIPEYS